MNWKCGPCKVEIPVSDIERIRRHLHTKKHARLKNGCPACGSLRLNDIDGETWDRDGIREAKKCARCNTEFKSYAHGLSEKEFDEYTGEKPLRIIEAEAEAFDRVARARGYTK
jgi:DNA-directed RNA polymerase subunit RPC12/RpoP